MLYLIVFRVLGEREQVISLDDVFSLISRSFHTKRTCDQVEVVYSNVFLQSIHQRR